MTPSIAVAADRVALDLDHLRECKLKPFLRVVGYNLRPKLTVHSSHSTAAGVPF